MTRGTLGSSENHATIAAFADHLKAYQSLGAAPPVAGAAATLRLVELGPLWLEHGEDDGREVVVEVEAAGTRAGAEVWSGKRGGSRRRG